MNSTRWHTKQHELLFIWLSSKNHYNYCNQMSHFKFKMHQIRFRLWLCPRPRCGSLQRSPDLLADLRGPTSKGREEKERGKEWEQGREERGPISESQPLRNNFLPTPLHYINYVNSRSELQCHKRNLCTLINKYKIHCQTKIRKLRLLRWKKQLAIYIQHLYNLKIRMILWHYSRTYATVRSRRAEG